MRRIAVLLFVLALPLAVACGSGKPASQPAHDITVTPGAVMPTAAAPTAEATSTTGSVSASGSDIFPLFFQNGLFGAEGTPGSALAGLGQGDPTLQEYLLTQADLPDGYTAAGTFNAHVPDGLSKTGGGDMAASTAMKGDASSGQGDVIMSMVMRFDDLQDLDTAFKDMNADQIQQQLGQIKDTPSGLFLDVRTLDTGGLGDHAAGFSMTMDMGVLLNSILGAFGDAFGAEGTPAAIPTDVPSKIEMHMYFFGRGSYVGALMHMSFGGSDSVDELVLAKLIDQRLSSAAQD